MSTQPEALRLADDLEVTDGLFMESQAAAELRRLHAENEDYGATIDYLTCENAERIGEIVALKEQRDGLLEALRGMLSVTDGQAIYNFMEPQRAAARAAIAKATGEQA